MFQTQLEKAKWMSILPTLNKLWLYFSNWLQKKLHLPYYCPAMITRLLPALVQTHLEKKKKNNNVIYEHYVLGTRCSPSIFFQSAFKPSASKTIISSGNVPAEE